jgi:predicted permease
MENFLLAIKTVAPLFIVIFVGVLFSRTKVNTQTWIDVLNKYALYIGFPALIIASLMHLKIGEQDYSKLIYLNSAYILVCIALAYPIGKILRLPRKVHRTLILILPFGNISYLGIPVLQNLMGDSILPAAAIISAIFVFWLITLAIILIEVTGEEKLNFKKLFFSLIQNPLLLSVIIGLALVFFKIELPVFASKTIQLFSDSVTAVVLFSLGIFMGIQSLGKIKDWLEVFGYVILTMLVLPFLLLLVLKQTNIDTQFMKALVIDAAMPLGLTPYALSIQYKLESTLTARIVVLGTFLSIIISPLWMAWMG